ncbi:hypothetical protein ACFO8N_05085 [Sneathiella chungangensis]|uniref:hypothetical protein n=1 Tax=Sneathiella chungangensis TaxID=1418234 RepID=UPI001F0ECB33|nr:hypothetical protein [Sneathiella chungangensis]
MQGLQGLLAAQGFFFAAQGLHGLQAFFAAQGLQGLQALAGFFAAQGLQAAAFCTDGTTQSDALDFAAAQGLQGLQGFFLAAHGLHGLQGFLAAQGLQALAGFFAAQGLQAAAAGLTVIAESGTATAPTSSKPPTPINAGRTVVDSNLCRGAVIRIVSHCF